MAFRYNVGAVNATADRIEADIQELQERLPSILQQLEEVKVITVWSISSFFRNISKVKYVSQFSGYPCSPILTLTFRKNNYPKQKLIRI